MNNLTDAKYYKKINSNVECLLCPHSCIISKDKTGVCGVRKNLDGRLFSTIYGELTATSNDPIEKKPLYHFYPAKGIFSIGTKGCNLSCPYCQNWHISQNLSVRTSYYSPKEIVNAALQNNSIGIAYTYSEPIIWIEYILDCSKLAREKGLKNVYVTNGFINPEPLEDILEYADAMNIDLKSFREDTYRKIMKGGLSNVLQTIERVYQSCHLELTTLVVTGVNDSIQEMHDIIEWINSVDKNIPWHISRYYPCYNYDAPSTDIDFMLKIYDEAVLKLNYVYCGNIAGSHGRSDTICPNCKSIAISRSGYMTAIEMCKNGKCSNCGYDLNIKQ
ncbi:MAG: AmmeMemoRadiSam system radical SAM enzyme [Spirochaetota bacterium]|nr:AmmeMemoRadiSam system radical SAM enzyme [Spirochaetota bacterium]